MILDPINDVECLGQLTTFSRELAPSTFVHDIAAHLSSREAVIRWLQSLPQEDDFGDERVRVIQCDVPQRVRLFPDDPNCVERSLAALLLLEVIEPTTARALATVEKPMRHTGLVEQYDGHWHAVDLFPRRNFSWTDLRVDTHNAGSGLLKAWLGKDLGGGIANGLGAGEDYLFGKVKTQKKPSPPSATAQREQQGQSQAELVATRRSVPGADAAAANATRLGGAGGTNGSNQEKATRGARSNADRIEGRATPSAASRGDRDSHDARDQAQRFWWRLGW